MNISMLKNKNAILILLCVLAIVAIYAVDIYPLAYKLTSWKRFGDLPIRPASLVYFVADTPNEIGYREPGTSEPISCIDAVAYFEVSGESGLTRCCQAETKISCRAGNYSADLPASDEACVTSMRQTFGVPASLQVFANCTKGTNPELTVAQMDKDGNLSWKYLTRGELDLLNIALRYLLAPILLGLAIRSAVILFRKPDPSRQIRW